MHTHDSPFPAVSDVVQDVGSGSRAETSGTLARCYVTGSTEKDAVLGYGLSIAGRSLIVSTPAELLSWDAFQRDGVRLSAEKHAFTHFWPALPSDGVAPAGAFAAIVAMCTREASKALGPCDVSDGAAMLTSKLITGVVVEMMKGDKPDATRFFSALLDFRRVLRCLVNPLLLGPPCDQTLQTGPNSANANLGQRLTARLRGFCDAEQARHKDACPNLGDMLSLYMCHPAACSGEDFIAAYLDENFLRCVMWWRKDGVQPASRPVFEAAASASSSSRSCT